MNVANFFISAVNTSIGKSYSIIGPEYIVKHARADELSDSILNSQLANLKNVLLALAALYILCQNLYKKLEDSQIELEPSKLFDFP